MITFFETGTDRVEHNLFSKGPLGFHAGLANDFALICAMNQKTLYKICKKLDRHLLGTSEAKNWFRGILKRSRYRFLQAVTMICGKDLPECPVCLETPPKQVVYPCGHSVCIDCDHLMTSRQMFLCPMCRTPSAGPY